MNDHQARIAEMSRVVRAWCINRTSSIEDAEDLCQDILLAMLESLPSLRNENAFYGFMWGVAGNVYRQWCKKRMRRLDAETSLQTDQGTLSEASVVTNPADMAAAMLPKDAPEDLMLLRRELTLLSRQYREAVVGYYLHGMRTADIAEKCGMSQSMVKYLLFRARAILKEGMKMERNFGQQSYSPYKLELRYWGHGPNHYYGAANSLIRQNILFACYHDSLTAEQIALEIGVSLPYMEGDLAELTEIGLLKLSGKRYSTDLVIFTKELKQEIRRKTVPDCAAIADCVKRFLDAQEENVRQLPAVAGLNSNTLRWQMATMLLHQAVVNRAGEQAQPTLCEDRWGVPCLCWGVEEVDLPMEAEFAFGVSQMQNERGDMAQFMDFPINGEMVHHAFFSSASMRNVFFQIARGETADFSENDWGTAAELVKKGYVLREGETLRVNCPVYSQKEWEQLQAWTEPAVQEIAEKALAMLTLEKTLIREHVPVHLRKTAEKMAYFRLFDDALSAPMALLYQQHVLTLPEKTEALPTTYVVLAGK